MALAVALGASAQEAPAGVVCFHGFLPEVEDLEFEWARSAHTRALVLHGITDDVVPIDFGRDVVDVLRHHRFHVAYSEQDAGHQLTVETLALAREWLRALLR